MTIKTSGEEYLHKTHKMGKKKTRIFMALVILSAIVLTSAMPVQASHQPTSIVIFTDKRTYNPYSIDLGKSGGTPVFKADFTADFSIYVYAMVLDERGLIMKGREGLVGGTLVDSKEYRHTNANNHIGATVNNPGIVGTKTLSFVDDGSVNGDISGDGIYTAVVDMPENIGPSLVAPTDELLINISVTDPQAGSVNTEVLITGFNCMSASSDYADPFKGHLTSGAPNPTPPYAISDNCVVCHRGYEHFFEDISGAIQYQYLDAHFKNATARSRVQDLQHSDVKGAKAFDGPFDWNLSDYNGAWGADTRTLEEMAPGSSFCYFCHTYNLTAPITKYGGERVNPASKPSCNNSNCHTTTKIIGTDIPTWDPAAAPQVANPSLSSPNYNIANAQQHAHNSTGGDTVPCAACHSTPHGLQIPNSTSTDYIDLSNRCLSCHTLFNKHNDSVKCEDCHSNDTHNIRFLQQDQSYNWSRSNIVTCDNCHSDTSFPGALGLSPPQVPYTNHSGDLNAGQKWGDYWTSVNQQNDVGGSTLIQTATLNFSSEYVIVGTTDDLSYAQTVDGIYEILTEGWALTIDEYRYIDSTSETFGTVTNLANAQSASDSEAYATFTSSSGSITNDTFFGYLIATTGTNGQYAELIDGLTATIAKKYVTIGNFAGLNNVYGISAVYACMKASTGDGTEKITLSHNKGATSVTYDPVGTALEEYCMEITSDISAPADLQTIQVTATEAANGGDSGGNVDAIWIQVSYSPTEAVNIIPSVIGARADDFYLEMNYYTSGDTFDIFVYNGSRWVDKGDLTQTGSFAVFNVTLLDDEHNEGNPLIRIMDKTADTTPGYLYIDYMRIHSYTGSDDPSSSHYESILDHNFTGIPKYSAPEVAEYIFQAKGYVTGENLHIYAYDYSAGAYLLVKDNAFPASNGWMNYSLPYSAISDTGNASIQFRDVNKTRYDDSADSFNIDYVSIKADNNKFLPCYYCHALLANHKKRAIGNIAWVQGGPGGTNPKNQSDFTGYWCANCHYNGSVPSGSYMYNGTAWSPVPPLIEENNVQNNTGSWYPHSVASDFSDAICKSCHGNAQTTTTKDFPHTVEVGKSGGPNCTNCHDAGQTSPSPGSLVNISAMGDVNAVHKDLNTGTGTSLPLENEKCWACHGNGSEPSGQHPGEYNVPKTCDYCHINTSVPFGTPQVSEHYRDANSINTTNVATCNECHNKNEMMLGPEMDPDGESGIGGGNGGNNSVNHYGKKRTDYQTLEGTNDYCYKCHNNITTVFPFASDYNKTIANHSLGYPVSNPDCGECHGTGRIHNDTLYMPVFQLHNSSYCTGTCHGPGGSATINNIERHNGSSGPECTQCHLNDSNSIHPVRYLQQDETWDASTTSAVNCVTCHQGTGLVPNFSSAIIIPTPINHSTNPFSGGLWNNSTQPAFWESASQQSSCDYCHGTQALHNDSGLGKTPSCGNFKNQSLTGSYWCANCHYNGESNYSVSVFDPEPPEVNNAFGFVPPVANDGTTPFKDHTSDLAFEWDDNKCAGCHDSGATNTIEFSHNVAPGGGGPNCTSCHNVGQSPPSTGSLVNISAMNDSSAIHSGLNINAISPSGLPAENFKCWACHGDGSEPSGHPPNYNNPYTCTDCHEPVSGQNMNFTPREILNVTQHYWNGLNINTTAATSCYICHNKTEMMTGLTLDPDGISPGVNGGANGGNDSVSHYGKKRTDYIVLEGSNNYCNECHFNTSTVFPFAYDSNKTIANHSLAYPTSNPDCGQCHSTGRIHNDTLYMPVFLLPNSTYCLICHGAGGNATIKDMERHNGSTGLNCTECHLNDSSSIHPARYLQQDGLTWDTSRINAVNCTTCHQGTGLGSFNAAPMVAAPINHSTDPYSGALWNGSYQAFWDNTSQQSSCDYCHGTFSLHNSSGLGNITRVMGSNTVRQDLTTSQWCANCHYASAPDYAGTTFDPEPPEILNASGKVPATSRSSANFVDHSGYLGIGYNDSVCKSCHDNELDAGATSQNLSHDLGIGILGGPNCTNCHNVDKTSPKPGTLVNFTAMNETGAIHSGLNRNAISSLPAENFKCWGCHGDGTEPGAHPLNYNTPYGCEDCHVVSGSQIMDFAPKSIMNVSQHYWNGTKLNTSAATSCYECHNKTEMMTGLTFDPDGADNDINGGANGGNASVSHYGKKRTDYPGEDTNEYCYKCHDNSSATGVFPYSNVNNATIANHSLNYNDSNPACKDCHGNGKIHNATLYKPDLTISNSSYCLDCHGLNITSGLLNFTGIITGPKEAHNTTLCSECHLETTKNIHPAQYLDQDGSTWINTNSSTVNCTACHQNSGLVNFSSAPLIQTPIWHSNNTYSGAMWNNSAQTAFWDNTSQQSSCDYCHGDVAIHNDSGLGISAIIQDENQKNQSLDDSYWCANCHFNGQPPGGKYQYRGDLLSPEPPEIFNLSGLVPDNASDGTPFQNHTTNIAPNDFGDSRCKNCHGKDLPGGTTSATFVHKLNMSAPESGGPDCLDCHASTASVEKSPVNRRVNATAFTDYSVHKNLNDGILPNSPMSFNNASVTCWACHGDGSEPIKHDLNYTNPKSCEYCHVDNNYNASYIDKHYPGSVFSGSIIFDNTDHMNRSCQQCHNNSVVKNLNLTIGSYSAIKLLNATVSHYSVNRTFGENNIALVTDSLINTTSENGCRLCHGANTEGGFEGGAYGNARNVGTHGVMGSKVGVCESICHNSQQVNITLHDQNVGIFNSACYSSDCHAEPAPPDGGGGRR